MGCGLGGGMPHVGGNTCTDELPLGGQGHHALSPRGLAGGFPGLSPGTVSSGASGFSRRGGFPEAGAPSAREGLDSAVSGLHSFRILLLSRVRRPTRLREGKQAASLEGGQTDGEGAPRCGGLPTARDLAGCLIISFSNVSSDSWNILQQ